MQPGSDCPSYDGISEYGGPCWTCRGVLGRCPMDYCASERSGKRCTELAGHTGYHRAETPDPNPRMGVGTHVLLWGATDQPDYPEGSIDNSEPWVVAGWEFREAGQ